MDRKTTPFSSAPYNVFGIHVNLSREFPCWVGGAGQNVLVAVPLGLIERRATREVWKCERLANLTRKDPSVTGRTGCNGVNDELELFVESHEQHHQVEREARQLTCKDVPREGMPITELVVLAAHKVRQ